MIKIILSKFCHFCVSKREKSGMQAVFTHKQARLSDTLTSGLFKNTGGGQKKVAPQWKIAYLVYNGYI